MNGISLAADAILKPALNCIPSYLSGSTHFIHTIEKTTVRPASLLVTFNVKSLYQNIPQEEGSRRFLDRIYRQAQAPLPPRWMLEELLGNVLEHNIFKFNNKTYRQISGVA